MLNSTVTEYSSAINIFADYIIDAYRSQKVKKMLNIKQMS